MNIQNYFKAKALLWGCLYLALSTTVCYSDSAEASKTTIVPLDSTRFVGNTSSINFKNEEIKLSVQSEFYNGTSNIETGTVGELLNDTAKLVNDTNTSPPDDQNTTKSKESKLNLAIIPVVAILIFMTVLCLKCCNWFRRYTRGEKDISGGGYDIVEQGDIDFDQIDIRSDSASTVYYDTVSSFCSFLRRNESDINVNSFKGSRLEQIKQEYNVSDKLLRDVKKRMAELDVLDSELYDCNGKSHTCRSSASNTGSQATDIDSPHNDTSKLLSNSPKRKALRTHSASSDVSADTEQSLLSESEKDSPKRQRFKVSFVTENSDKERTNKQYNDINTLKPIISNNRTSNATMTDMGSVYRPRAHSLNTPEKQRNFLQMHENNVNSKSSKIVCKVDIEKDNVGNKIKTLNSGARPKTSPIPIKRPVLREKEQRYNANTTGENGPFVARRVLYGKLRSISDCTESQTGIIKSTSPILKDCSTQTDKSSFRLPIRKGRKRYMSEINADENIIPPTISELVEMCSCKLPKNANSVLGEKVCTCDSNSLDDISCDDVFGGDEKEISIANTCDPKRVAQDTNSAKDNGLNNDGENRLTNHERSKDTKRKELLPVTEKYTAGVFSSEELYPTLANNQIGKLSSSTHNISEIKNDPNGNLLSKYCNKCHNFNKSVPNLCYTCQKHSIAADYISKAEEDKHLKNRCKSCSQFSWTNSVNRGKLLRQNNVRESELEISALDRSILKRESSLASDDLSFSSSSLSSSGYVEISSDVSSL